MKIIKRIPLKLIWAQVFALVLWFLITVIEWTNNPKSNPGIMIPVIIRATEALSIFLISSLFILVLENIQTSLNKVWIRFLLLLAIYPGAMVANLLSLGIRSLIGYAPPPLGSFFFIHSLHFYLPMLLVLVTYAIVRNQIEITEVRENKLKAETLAQQARWVMLRYQVNPHFLFNALNSIRALIGEDDKNARRIVTELAEYFRYSLTRDKATLVSLKEEMYAVGSYLEIQKIRFRSRLEVVTELSPVTLSCAVPVFSVQTLVENAIKYGMKTSPGTLQITISSCQQDDILRIKVTNTGKLFAGETHSSGNEGSGTGLKNLKERLKHLDPFSQFLLSEEDGHVVAQFDLTVKALENETMEGTDYR